MIEDEVRLALEALLPEQRPPLVWVESGLHERPERLQAALKDLIERSMRGDRPTAGRVPSVRPGPGPAAERREEVLVGPVKEVLLALGFCGNALKGLRRASDPSLPAGGRLHVAPSQPGLRPRGDPEEPAPLLPHQGLVQSRELPESRPLRTGTSAMGPSEPKSCGRPCSRATSRSISSTPRRTSRRMPGTEPRRRGRLKLEHGIVRGSVQLLERLFKGERDSEIVSSLPGRR